MNRFLLLLLFLSQSLQAATVIDDQTTIEVLTPSLQNRETRKLRLENGLEAYLISDPDLDQSAAALSVEAGAFQDPESSPGMAHFLEHMLFLGTSKFPEENGYQRYVSEHGGHTNAYTTSDHTNYAFTVNHDGFEETLERFSWFFKEPLFNPSGVEREMQAVDQEHGKNIENDRNREYYISKEIANSKHPYSRFQTGNLETLKEISQDSLKKWYQTHYSANLMHLVVISNQDLDTLQEWVTKEFEGVPDHNLERFSTNEPLFTEDVMGQILYITPMKDLRELSLTWELPQKFAHNLKKKPDDLIGFVLGHEGEESLLEQLKREGLAEALSAGGGQVGRDNFSFEIQIRLTTKGVNEVDTVTKRCHQAIQRLREEGIPSYLFDESQQMALLNHQYQQRSNPFTWLCNMRA